MHKEYQAITLSSAPPMQTSPQCIASTGITDFRRSLRHEKLHFINGIAGTGWAAFAFIQQMQKFRFITPNRTGKWYPDLESAKRFASRIGAGFFESRTGQFIAYAETRLEVSAADRGNDTFSPA